MTGNQPVGRDARVFATRLACQETGEFRTADIYAIAAALVAPDVRFGALGA
jgi:hypothetical protein